MTSIDSVQVCAEAMLTSYQAKTSFQDEALSTPRVATTSERNVATSKSRPFRYVLMMKIGATLDKFIKQESIDVQKLQRR